MTAVMLKRLWDGCFVFVMAIVIVPISGSPPSCQPLTQCPSLPFQHFGVHGESLSSKLSKNGLYENKTSRCSLNVEEVLTKCDANSTNGDIVRFVFFVVGCKFRRHVIFERSSMIGYRNAVVSFQSVNCRIGLDDLNWFGTVVDLRVVQLINTDVLPSAVTSPDSLTYVGLSNVVSLAMINGNSTNRLDTMFPRPDVFRSLAEVQFHNMSIKSFPDDFANRMPRLQSLDLSQNSLLTPPSSFPWYSSDYRLPRNLSRTNVFNRLYTTQIEISLAANLFRRTLNLDGNRIRTLRNSTFNGRLQLISIARNGLFELGEETFANVTGLQKLDLSYNELISLSPETFKGPAMIDLQYLYLQTNQITTITNKTFQGVPNIVSLHLSGNKLVRLQTGTFSSMLKLRSLHLENNQLEYISRGSFPLENSELTDIFLMNNNLKRIPSDVFLLRNMRMVDLSGCQISLRDINVTLAEVPLIKFQYVLLDSSRITGSDFDENLNRRTKLYTRVINLNNNLVDTIPVIPIPQYELMLIHYKLDLLNNPLACFCNMAGFVKHLNAAKQSQIFDGTEYLFNDLKCQTPSLYAGRNLMSLHTGNLYCSAKIFNCPQSCECWTYYGSRQHLVDCSGRFLTDFPVGIPDGTIELRLESNNISTLATVASHMGHIVRLDLSRNQIGSISEEFFDSLPNLRVLNLEHNGLTGLPQNIQRMSLERIRLAENHFRCDCHNRWMKKWIIANKGRVQNWDTITCVRPNEKVSPLTLVPDKEYVCIDESHWKYTHIAASVVSVLIVSMLIIGILCRYFWLDIKALLFARFNVRLCEKIEHGQHNVVLDVFVLSAQDNLDWSRKHVLEILETSNMFKSLAQCFQHFVAGLSLRDNFDLFIDNSDKIVVVLSESFFADEQLVYALERVVQKALKQRRNYVVFIQQGVIPKTAITSEQLRRFLRAQKMLKPTDKLIKEKLLYSASSSRKNDNDKIAIATPWKVRLLQSMPKTDRACRYDFYLAYGEQEYAWASAKIRVRLENEGWITCIPDRDFVPGTSKDEVIVESIQDSRYVILVLSNSFAMEEWSMFVFRAARQIAIKERNNYLIVILTEGTDISAMNKNIQSYLRAHTYLSEQDPVLFPKLADSVIGNRGTAEIGTNGPAPDLIQTSDIDTHV